MSIQLYRKQKGLTQAELAESVGVAQSYICALEGGKKQNPSIRLLIKVSGVLGVSLEKLVDDYKKVV